MSDLYSVKDVSKLFDLQEARLRYWAQTGFVGPSIRQSGRAFYTFEDLIGVKVAKELLDSGLPLQRVRKNLDALRTALPQVDRPLSRLKVCSDGDKVVVVGDDVAFEPATGQLLLTFAVSTLSNRISDVLTLPTKAEPSPDLVPARETTGYEAFLAGLRAEDAGDPTLAEASYRAAIAQDPQFAAAWTNLGNILERRGARGEAREAYEKALALDPEQPEARFNLANVLADMNEVELAAAQYRRVVALTPEFADAHFNLALLHARSGAPEQARGHLLRYLELDGESPWAAQARELLVGLDPKAL